MKKVFRWVPLFIFIMMAVVLIYQEADAIDVTCDYAEWYCKDMPPSGLGGSFELGDCWDGGQHWYCYCSCWVGGSPSPVFWGICTFS